MSGANGVTVNLNGFALVGNNSCCYGALDQTSLPNPRNGPTTLYQTKARDNTAEYNGAWG